MHGVAAQVEIEQKMKAVYHILGSSANFQAVSTWVSQGQPALAYHGVQ